jgi:hypothetical protein
MGGTTRWGEKEGDDPESSYRVSPEIFGCRASGDPAAADDGRCDDVGEGRERKGGENER